MEIKQTKRIVIKQTIVGGKVVSEERTEQIIKPAKGVSDEVQSWFDKMLDCFNKGLKELFEEK